MTRQSIAIAVFVKTPGCTPLKTRLAAEIGAQNAEQFHRLATRCLEETLLELQSQGETGEIVPFWSVAEPEGHQDSLWSAFPVVGQGEGGLGERMHHVYAELLDRHDAVFLLGADTPQISVADLAAAVDVLFASKEKKEEEIEFVLGPANDGGFVFLGGRREISLDVWQRVPYSVPETTELLLRELRSLGRVETLGEWVDVDVWPDLCQIMSVLREASESTAKSELTAWIQSLISERENRA
ncbi:MAG: DUF2064 domain-containing protein [Planctomycetaceae bacterium]|nr:DUF2064 domain-containing protein [Planctomycetaceae bacterium]